MSWLDFTMASSARPPKFVSKPQIRCSGSIIVSLCPIGDSSSTDRQCATTLSPGFQAVTPGPTRSFGTAPVVLEVQGLNKSYRSGGGFFGGAARRVDALVGVDFRVRRGETVGIVGESGSGKSTVARCITRLIEADNGQILVNGADIAGMNQRQLRPVRRRLQIVFQDPFGSLNPRRTVGQLISEGPVVHGTATATAWARALDLLELVGLERRAAQAEDGVEDELAGAVVCHLKTAWRFCVVLCV